MEIKNWELGLQRYSSCSKYYYPAQVIQGAASFVKKTVFGFSDSLTKVTGSVGKGEYFEIWHHLANGSAQVYLSLPLTPNIKIGEEWLRGGINLVMQCLFIPNATPRYDKDL